MIYHSKYGFEILNTHETQDIIRETRNYLYNCQSNIICMYILYIQHVYTVIEV